MAVALLAIGLTQPRAFVWCQTETGHAALEALDTGCCSAAGLEASCSARPAQAGSGEPAEGAGIGNESCRDLLVEAPAWRPLEEKPGPLPSAVLRLRPFGAALAPLPGPAASRRDAGVGAAAHELLLSTVLRV